MGGQQSTRRLTVINDEATGVIKVILVCDFSIYVYNSCYTYQMFCFVCFFSLIKAFRLITISLNLSQRQYYITFSFIERDRE